MIGKAHSDTRKQPPSWTPVTLTFRCSHHCEVPSATTIPGWFVWPAEYSRSDGVTSEVRLQKTLWLPSWSLFLFLGTFTLGEARCHVLRTLEQPCREAHVTRSQILQSAASEEVKPATSHVGRTESGSSSLQMRLYLQPTAWGPPRETPSARTLLLSPF